jgi:hypothetical protein
VKRLSVITDDGDDDEIVPVARILCGKYTMVRDSEMLDACYCRHATVDADADDLLVSNSKVWVWLLRLQLPRDFDTDRIAAVAMQSPPQPQPAPAVRGTRFYLLGFDLDSASLPS